MFLVAQTGNIVADSTMRRTQVKQKTLNNLDTVEPRFNEPRYNEVLVITNTIEKPKIKTTLIV